MSKVKVYKASAGSGKTFKLAEEYIILLFQKPFLYKSILAVTFTNKATAEMKERIVQNLYLLSQGMDSPYVDSIKEKIGLSDKQMQAQAQQILQLILHDYSRFSIETIDSFFQKVLRAFTKEVGFYSGFTIELDNQLILNEAIEVLLHEEIKTNPKLKKWIAELIRLKLNDEKAWNVRKDLMELGKEIFKESYQKQQENILAKLDDEKFLKAYSQDLQAIIQSYEKTLRNWADQAIALLQTHNLDKQDFKNKKNSFVNCFNKIQDGNFDVLNTYVLGAVDQLENWITKTSDKKDQIEIIYHAGLNDFLKKIVQKVEKDEVNYISAKRILSNIYVLGIIGDISRTIHHLTKDKNVFLLADASYLLNSIIRDNDSPFIYEKTGTFFKHFMIDEFQDTSLLQWNNFQPLILNSLSEGFYSLVVGDVKQSIYRWRNSDWKILGEEIKSLFPVEEIPLDTNYRSLPKIIEFNNQLFEYIPGLLQNKFHSEIEKASHQDALEDLKGVIERAYHKPAQKVHLGDQEYDGYVELHFYTEDVKDTFVRDNLPEKIKMLQDQGYRARDIAILVRKNTEGQEIAEILLEQKKHQKDTAYNFDVISNDSLFIKSAPAVQLILSALKVFENPSSDLYAYELYTNYLRTIDQLDRLHELVQYTTENSESERYLSALPEDFQKLLQKPNFKSLYHLVEKIIDTFKINERKEFIPYSIAFLDMVSDFTEKNYLDIPSFLEYWEQNDKKTISAPDSLDAIRILTIHKAKGLQFKAVMIPFNDWPLNDARKRNIIWCKTDVSPFDRLDLIPVHYTEKLNKTIFSKAYYQELNQQYIDNLNLLYVAYTRAEEVFISFSKVSNSVLKNKDIESIKSSGELHYYYLQSSAKPSLEPLNEKEKVSINYGELLHVPKTDPERENDKNRVLDHFPIIDSDARIKMALHSDSFFESGLTTEGDYIRYGNLMHSILSRIDILKDIDQSIDEAILQGEISGAERKKYMDYLHKILSGEHVKKWFDGSFEVRNETPILLKNGKIRRPDRVMIKSETAVVVDYKFVQNEALEHQMQVNEYKDLLLKLGYRNVQGFVWYVFLDRIVKI